MSSQSILVGLTNCAIADRSNNSNNVTRNDSNPTATCEHTPNSELDEVFCDDAGRINRSRKRLKVAKDKTIAILGSNDDSTATPSQV